MNRVGSPVWTRFELLRANSHCDRTHGRTLFSERSGRIAGLSPWRAPSLDTSRIRQGDPAVSGCAVILPQTARIALPFATFGELSFPEPSSDAPRLRERSSCPRIE